MKTLYLFRHAKSSWDDPRLADEERPLTPKGISKTLLVTRYLKDKGIRPDLMISSHAVRAYETALIAAKELIYPKDLIRLDPLIYTGSEDQLHDLICGTENTVGSLMLFGHNPTITQLANLFLHPPVGEMPTSAAVGITFDADKWEEIPMSIASNDFFVYPGLLKKT